MVIENVKCPVCGGPMVSRANRQSGQRFWGCQDYPRCTGTRNTDGEAPRSGAGLGSNYVNDDRDDVGLPSERMRDRDRHRW